MASSIQLINCQRVVVESDVVNFTGVGLSDVTIDSTYSNTTQIGNPVGATKPNINFVTGDFTIDGKHSIHEIDLDAIGAAVNCTWVASLFPIQQIFKITNNTGVWNFNITTDPLPTTITIDGAALPYTTGLTTNQSLTVYSNGTDLKIIT